MSLIITSSSDTGLCKRHFRSAHLRELAGTKSIVREQSMPMPLRCRARSSLPCPSQSNGLTMHFQNSTSLSKRVLEEAWICLLGLYGRSFEAQYGSINGEQFSLWLAGL